MMIWSRVFILILMFLFTINAWAEDKTEASAKIKKAGQLVFEFEKYDEAILLLEPIIGQNFTASYYHHEAYMRLNKQKEYVQKVQAIADKGNPFVSYFVASTLKYLYPKDPLEIEKYYLNAYNGGMALAAKALGNIYYQGLTSNSITEVKPRVPRNLKKAKAMFESCADDSVVGLDCTEGLGHVLLELNPDKPFLALENFEKAKAYGTLWGMYYFGIGVVRDLHIAQSYKNKINKIIEDKNFNGQAACFLIVRDSAEDFESENPKAIVDIAYGFNSGEASCFPQRPNIYIDLLKKAAALGSVYAVAALSDHFYFGDIVPKDDVLAYLYSAILSIYGNQEKRQEGMDRLATLEKLMTKQALDEAKLQFRIWQQKMDIEKRTPSVGKSIL